MDEHFKTELIPSENKKHLVRFFKLPFHACLVPWPFAMGVVGAAGSGKSSLIWTIVSKYYRSAFDIMIVYNGSKDSNSTWKKLETKSTKVDIRNEFNMGKFGKEMEHLENVNVRRQQQNKLPINVLVVMDDMIATDAFHANRRDALQNALLNRRHIHMSIIVSSQRYKSLPQNFRAQNIDALVVAGVGAKDLEMIAEEHTTLKVSPDDIKEMYTTVKREDKYKPFIIMVNKAEEERFRNGWTKVFNVTEIV